MLAPTFATDDAADLILPYSVFVGERLLADATLPVSPPNVYHLSKGDLRVGIQFSANIAALPTQPSLHRGIVHVRSLVAEEKVFGLRAGGVVASVQDEHPGRDGAVVEFPGDAGCADIAVVSPASAHDTVALDGSAAPAPAGLGLHDFVPEAFGQRPSHPLHYSRVEG